MHPSPRQASTSMLGFNAWADREASSGAGLKVQVAPTSSMVSRTERLDWKLLGRNKREPLERRKAGFLVGDGPLEPSRKGPSPPKRVRRGRFSPRRMGFVYGFHSDRLRE